MKSKQIILYLSNVRDTWNIQVMDRFFNVSDSKFSRRIKKQKTKNVKHLKFLIHRTTNDLVSFKIKHLNVVEGTQKLY